MNPVFASDRLANEIFENMKEDMQVVLDAYRDPEQGNGGGMFSWLSVGNATKGMMSSGIYLAIVQFGPDIEIDKATEPRIDPRLAGEKVRGAPRRYIHMGTDVWDRFSKYPFMWKKHFSVTLQGKCRAHFGTDAIRFSDSRSYQKTGSIEVALIYDERRE